MKNPTARSKINSPALAAALIAASGVFGLAAIKVQSRTLTGQAALGDWTTDAPGVRRKITVADLPRPYATRSVDNGPFMIRRPQGAWPKAPAGFTVELYAGGLSNPREIVTAPNGDLFISESDPGRIRILRGRTPAGKPKTNELFASGLSQPFGIAFYPPGPNPKWVYVANTDSVVRFPYKNGDLKATGRPQLIANVPSGGRLRGGGHWTRDIRFSANGNKMYVSVGSATNDFEGSRGREERRADILEFDPDGKNERIYAYGIRNAVGLAIHPTTGQLWCSVNERDVLGDHLVPDYITRVKEGGFYGWPWFYIGPHQDPRHPGEHPELKNKVIVPDVLVQSHMASLCMTFYTGSTFPAEYRNDGFAAQHGSWNRLRRTGYKVIRVPLKNGAPTGEYEDFLTGFVTPEGHVWGRPVGVTTAPDGALMVTDDGSNSVWRIQHK
ncbi:PQQ-dependent sugar dehydrogenase [Fimbriimonas ginsengisoli]|uniref:L-sorbosone dehydrogenase n=1 Tax=Fimbriimonas ginsengisoli Gsoil 348 TaxID=661478 RepID=A0A068NQU7_FIMGI|nr:sorbosone dehydrogenase family protein [Fimbriimonas ginsengisoli]AIE85923.1 L-sorbosone dehydrogenase [Fimbriimonas ginsengisoli Gsoil 348]